MQITARMRLATITLAAAAATTGALAVASPAMAKTPTCTTAIQVPAYDGYAVVVPGYASGYDGATVLYSDKCVLSRGDSGNAVKALQRGINFNGSNVAVDGQYGPATEKGVKHVQTANGLSADGVYGPKTRDKMCWPLASDQYTCEYIVLP